MCGVATTSEHTATAVASPRRLPTSTPPRLPDDRLMGWLWPLVVMVLGGVLRVWRLSTPHAVVFDELYYPSDAKDLLRYGVEVKTVDGKIQPDFVAHPPLGKWVIGIGEQIFSDPQVAARASTCALGILSILILARTARRMFGSTLLGCTAGLLLALEGLHIVMSRTGILDSIIMFWVLLAFSVLLIDRDANRTALLTGVRGPWAATRPWRLGAGIALGAACATKWNSVFLLAGFAVMSMLWDVAARRAADDRHPLHSSVVHDLPLALGALVIVPVAVYLASWTGWFLAPSSHAYHRTWADTHPATGWATVVPEALRSLWHYHTEMWNFNVHLTTPHNYQSNPWSWLIQGRPVAFFYNDTMHNCSGGTCSQEVLALGTPAIWWAATLALPVLAYQWLGRRDWRAGAILLGVAAGYLPWFHYQERTIFSFYAVVFVPFLCLAITMVIGLLLGPDARDVNRRTWASAVTGAYVLLVAINTLWLYPILTAQVIPRSAWLARLWFRSWL